MFKSLRVRLTLLFLGLMAIPLLIVGVLLANRSFAILEIQAVEFQSQLARETAISLGAFFSERQNELSVLTDVSGIDTLESAEQRNLMLALLSKQLAYYELILINADGDEIHHITRGEIITSTDLSSHADDPLFQQAVESRSVKYSPVYFSERARDWLLTMAIPVEDLFTGEIGNVLVAEIRFQNIQEEVLRSLNLAANEDVYVVDANNTVIAHRNPSIILTETKFEVPAQNGRHVGLGGEDVLLATEALPLENLELAVVAQTTYESATAVAANSSQVSAVIIGLTLLGAGIIVTIVVSRVVHPIVNISRVAEAIQGGNLDAKAEVYGSDEIATLGRTFNSMTAQLKSTLSGLQDNIDQLEKSKVEREKLIRDLQTAKRIAEENSRLKSEFLSTMSHELRTPLNAIEGFTSIMLGGMGIELTPRAEDMTKRISSNSKRLLSLINDFLDLSRIESGRLELVQEPISPAVLAEKWQKEVSVLAESKGIEFSVDIDPTLPDMIYGDEDALSKIAINLLGNAFKFTHNGFVSLSLAREESTWTISVSDTGIGIPLHAREYIFDEFRQVDGSSKREFGGTGLGLALVQKLSRAMGGNITIQSEVGAGSTFIVSLPLITNLEINASVEEGIIA